MYTADYFIEKLDMIPHREGGFYKESFKSEENIENRILNDEKRQSKKLWSSIYFLLKDKEVSNFHRLK